MSVPARLTAFAVLLVAVFAAAMFAGAAIDPSPRSGTPAHDGDHGAAAAGGGPAGSDAPHPIRGPGTYRALADFSHEGIARTLGADLRVSGDADLGARGHLVALREDDLAFLRTAAFTVEMPR